MKTIIKKDRKALHDEMCAYILEREEIKEELINFGILVSTLIGMEHREIIQELKNTAKKRVK